MSRIHHWRYTLRSRSALNARSARREHEGALIRVGDGFGCLHPWPELGDAPLSEQLELLGRGETTPLIRSALACAELDGEARREKRSLFRIFGKEIPQPENHHLAAAGDDPNEIRSRGFSRVKLKVGPSLPGVKMQIMLWSEAGFRVRLDANETVSARAWIRFWMHLAPDLREAVEFIEDPCPWGMCRWPALRAIGLPLAADRDVEARLGCASVAVYKPAVDGSPPEDALDTRLVDWAGIGEQRRIVVTSYMDHAIGQMWAAYTAGCLERGCPERLAPCGLLTHEHFEPDDFFDRVRTDGPRLQTPEGTGLGFDDLLEKLPWKALP